MQGSPKGRRGVHSAGAVGFTMGGSRTCPRGCDTPYPHPWVSPLHPEHDRGFITCAKACHPHSTRFRDPCGGHRAVAVGTKVSPGWLPAGAAAPGSRSCLGYLLAPTFPKLRGLSPSSGGSWTPVPGSWHGTGLGCAGLPGLCWESWAGVGIAPARAGVTQAGGAGALGRALALGTGAWRGRDCVPLNVCT